MSQSEASDGGCLPLTQFGQIVGACDRFEAEWRAGRRPRIEQYLAEASEPCRSALLRELLALELELRRGRGERPEPGEYRARFPEHSAVVDAAFEAAARGRGAGRTARGQPAASRRRPRPALRPARPAEQLHRPRRAAGRLRRLGRRQVPAAGPDPARARCRWTPRPTPCSRPWPASTSDLHGGDPEASLAALSSLGLGPRGPGAGRRPRAPASLAHVASPRARREDPDATASHAPRGTPRARPGGSASCGSHAQGGLGEVYVARDEELHREVALKEIQDRVRRRPRTAGPASSSRPRSPAAWSTRASCRSTAWAPTTTAGRSTPCGSSRATASRRPSSASTRQTGRAATRARGRWSCASCCGGSSTSATQWPTRTAGACCTAT